MSTLGSLTASYTLDVIQWLSKFFLLAVKVKQSRMFLSRHKTTQTVKWFHKHPFICVSSPLVRCSSSSSSIPSRRPSDLRVPLFLFDCEWGFLSPGRPVWNRKLLPLFLLRCVGGLCGGKLPLSITPLCSLFFQWVHHKMPPPPPTHTLFSVHLQVHHDARRSA